MKHQMLSIVDLLIMIGANSSFFLMSYFVFNNRVDRIERYYDMEVRNFNCAFEDNTKYLHEYNLRIYALEKSFLDIKKFLDKTQNP